MRRGRLQRLLVPVAEAEVVGGRGRGRRRRPADQVAGANPSPSASATPLASRTLHVPVVEGEVRTLRQWDFLHCPAGTVHVFVGAGEGPCAVLMVWLEARGCRALPGQRGGGQVRRVREYRDRRPRGGLRRLAPGAASRDAEPVAAWLAPRGTPGVPRPGRSSRSYTRRSAGWVSAPWSSLRTRLHPRGQGRGLHARSQREGERGSCHPGRSVR